MKKILLVINGTSFPQNAIRFISRLNEKSPVLLTGFFLPEIVSIENWAAYSAESTGSLEDAVTAANIKTFEEQCANHHIEYRVHRGTNEPADPQVIKETRYSDLLIASGNAFYKETPAENTYDNLKKIMRHGECPVLVVPERFDFPDQVMIACDGSASSAYAMKQFAYLFPELNSLDTRMIHIGDRDEDGIPGKEYAADWAERHFSHFSMHSVAYEAGEYLGSESNPKTVLVVTGSYGRSSLSERFRKSFAEDLIRKYHLLLFSAHT